MLRELLSNATEEERLSITKLIDSSKNKPYKIRKLQEEISLLGGHGIINIFRGEGTGYLDVKRTLKLGSLNSRNVTV